MSPEDRKKLIELIADKLGKTSAEVETAPDFKSLGADSLGIVELMMAIEDEFGVMIPDNDASGLTTVDLLVRYIETAKAAVLT